MCSKFDTTKHYNNPITDDNMLNDNIHSSSNRGMDKSKKPLLLMMDNKTPKRLMWNMNVKEWEWKSEQVIDTNDLMNTDSKYTPKRNGWCWEGIHCTNPYCKFKHRNLPPVDSNPHSSLPSSIRGPRQHKLTSNI